MALKIYITDHFSKTGYRVLTDLQEQNDRLFKQVCALFRVILQMGNLENISVKHENYKVSESCLFNCYFQQSVHLSMISPAVLTPKLICRHLGSQHSVFQHRVQTPKCFKPIVSLTKPSLKPSRFSISGPLYNVNDRF